jgi:hypothetical protein
MCAALRTHLDGGPLSPPEGTRVLWQTFLRLSARRGTGQHGPNPITFGEIEAYTRLMRVPLEPEHVDVILGMDDVWLEHAGRARERAPEGVKTIPRSSGQPITPAMFDAVLG